jgi:hypothetical protein
MHLHFFKYGRQSTKPSTLFGYVSDRDIEISKLSMDRVIFAHISLNIRLMERCFNVREKC